MLRVALLLLALTLALPLNAQEFPLTRHEEPREVAAFTFEDAEGQEIGLDAFAGKTVLLNLWATWCVPCREEMPALDNLQAAMGGEDFQVVPLSLDRASLAKIQGFYQETALQHLPIYHDQRNTAGRVLRAPGLPTTLLLNGEGQEIARVLGPAEWDSEEAMAAIRAAVAE